MNPTSYSLLQDLIGGTRMCRIQRLLPASAGADSGNTLLCKLEGDNPAGSVKDRPANNMIRQAALRGDIRPGDLLVEATSGNTGIALAMVAASMGYRMRLIMPDNMTAERAASMTAYGAELIYVTEDQGMEYARDLADDMAERGEGYILNQFSNKDNPQAHYLTTGPELFQATGGSITHFVSSMGTTGTIMGVSRYLKEQNPDIQIIGVQPQDGSSIPGIRRWPEAYLPKIYEADRVDRIIDVSAEESEEMARRLASEEGVFSGVSSGGAMVAALQIATEVENAVIVSIVCDRGDRYISSGLFPS